MFFISRGYITVSSFTRTPLPAFSYARDHVVRDRQVLRSPISTPRLRDRGGKENVVECRWFVRVLYGPFGTRSTYQFLTRHASSEGVFKLKDVEPRQSARPITWIRKPPALRRPNDWKRKIRSFFNGQSDTFHRNRRRRSVQSVSCLQRLGGFQTRLYERRVPRCIVDDGISQTRGDPIENNNDKNSSSPPPRLLEWRNGDEVHQYTLLCFVVME